jgi:hypothetical protein
LAEAPFRQAASDCRPGKELQCGLCGVSRGGARQILVFISATTARSTPIPPELVSRMHRFVVESEPAPPAKKKKSAKTKPS